MLAHSPDKKKNDQNCIWSGDVYQSDLFLFIINDDGKWVVTSKSAVPNVVVYDRNCAIIY